MLPDLSSIFAKYDALAAEADAVFGHVAGAHPDCVSCAPGCSDCCHALFDLPLVEAMRLNQAFNEKFQHGPLRSRIIERASQADRGLARAKRDLYRAEKSGESAERIMGRAAALRSTCPLLDEDSRCQLYERRPITCRLYGAPLEISGASHVCGFSGFAKGKGYPAVKMAKIQERLDNLSREIAAATGSRFKLHEVYVPLSMALLTTYDEKYLGIGKPEADD